MASGTITSRSEPAFHADDLDQTTEYRSLSVLAIIGLVLGLASPFCLAAPLLMVIPLVGAAVSILALQRIAASDGALAGRWAAAIGLLLCVGCAVGAITHKSVVRTLRSNQAEAFGRSWIDSVISGKTDDAFVLTTDGLRPPAPPEPGMPAPAKSPRDAFVSNPLIVDLAAAGADADVRFDGTTSYEMQTDRFARVGQKFSVTSKTAAKDAKSDAGPIELLLTVTRGRVPGGSSVRWLVSGYSKPTAQAASTSR